MERKTVGSLLRETREARGLQLEDAVRVTRIGKNYLAALEGDLFDRLPSPAYIKGFLRAYAAFLGLSGDEVVEMYERGRHGGRPEQPEEGWADSPAGVATARGTAGRRWLSLFVLPVLAGVALYLAAQKDSGKQQPRPVPGEGSVTASSPVHPVRTSVRKPAAPALGDGKTEESPAPSPPLRKGIVLRLRVIEDGWLDITIDGNVSQRYELKSGDLIEWKGENSFTLDLGDAGGVEADLDGRPLQPFGERGKPAHVVLKGEGAED